MRLLVGLWFAISLWRASFRLGSDGGSRLFWVLCGVVKKRVGRESPPEKWEGWELWWPSDGQPEVARSAVGQSMGKARTSFWFFLRGAFTVPKSMLRVCSLLLRPENFQAVSMSCSA